MKVLIAVTHLLGTGHLARALTLGRAFAAAGHDVCLLSGGSPQPHMDAAGVRVVQVPALASDGVNFARLLQPSGAEADLGYLMQRADCMVDALRNFAPDAVITELFPFGRRSLSAEFLSLLEAAQNMRPAPVVLASIRDILAPPSKPSKAARCDEVLRTFYDGVLVHSDPSVIQLEASWPVTDDVSPMLQYTGFVAPTPPVRAANAGGQNEVIVSAGGGAVGEVLFDAALDAAKQSDLKWRFLIGGKGAAQQISVMKRAVQGDNITIEGVRPDFRSLLLVARCSVSMCGYNTTMDLLQTGVPAVVMPFDDGGEVEQGLRAQSLAKLPAIEVVKTSHMSAKTLLTAITRATVRGRRDQGVAGFDGAQEAVRITAQMVGKR